MSTLLALPLYRLTDSNGVLIPNGRLYTFETGTLTPAPTYTTAALNVSHGSYVQANSAGLLPAIYLDPLVTYRFQVRASPYASAVSGMDFDPVTAATLDDITFEPDGANAVPRTAQDKLKEIAVSPLDFRASSDTDDMNAINRAIAAAALSGRPVYLPAGEGLGDDGEWMFHTLVDLASRTHYLPAGTYIFGDRGRTVVRPVIAGETVFRAVSSAAGTFIDGITIRDLILYGYVEDAGFEEQVPLAGFNGVRDLLVESVVFKGFQGDGLFIGSGEVGTHERHNYNVTVRDCTFDGVNNNNRQGISIIDVDGMVVENCVFKNVTKVGDPLYVSGPYDVMDPNEGLGMPGAIDLEPNTNAFHIIRNVVIDNCCFENVGGNVGCVSIAIPVETTTLPKAITIRDCKFRGYDGTGADIFISTHRALTSASADMQILIEGCHGADGESPYDIRSGKGVTLSNNVWDTYTVNATIGDAAIDKAWDVTLSNERMHLCGSETDGRGIRIGTAERIMIDGLLLDKCGAASSNGFPIQFATGVTSAVITIDRLRVIANTSQATAIDNEGGAHTFTAAGNRINLAQCDLGGLASEFSATAPGQVLPPVAFTWDPGSLIDGAGETSTGVTVTGAAFGDSVTVTAPYDLQGITLNAYVSASNTIKARLQNETTGTIDLASGSWKATVTKALS